MNETTPLLPGLSPVGGKVVAARFDGGALSSDAGLLALREVERRLDVAGRLAACIDDPRDPSPHRARRRGRPALPDADDLCWLRGRHRRQCPARRPGVQDGARAAAGGARPLLAVHRQPAGEPARPAHAAEDGPRHGRALLRILRAGPEADHARHRRHLRRRPWRAAAAAVQRPLRRLRLPADRGVRRRGPVRRCGAAPGEAAEGLRDRRASASADPCDPLALAAGRDPAPRRRPLLRARGAPPLPRQGRGLRLRPADHQRAAPPCGDPRGLHHGARSGRRRRQAAAGSRNSTTAPPPGAGWSASSPASRPGRSGCDTRFIVTSLASGTGKTLYEELYCARGQAENHIKAWKAHLAADRTSCTSAAANQLRLFLHAGAYWLMWTLRAALPRRSPWRRAQFDTLRLRLIKIAARVVELKTRVTRPPAERLPRRAHHAPAAPAAPAHGADLTTAPTDVPARLSTATSEPKPHYAPQSRARSSGCAQAHFTVKTRPGPAISARRSE